ncbi:MAG TPA: phospholipid carrier-dependent glycosyltransferase [Anaerolineales bacterium]|nr:phospholipid carrier-dependent glycosyltransferase [Anaerolineales bacterium]
MAASQNIRAWLERHEWIIPLGLLLLFLAFTLPGISWGPWHPDEIVVRSIKALHGEWRFSEINFNYPDLPQYVMFFLGKAILALGYTDGEILVASRILSAVVAGLTIPVTYAITRRAGGNMYMAGLSGLLLLCASELSFNGRFAHNDTYTVFFTTLSTFFMVGHAKTGHRGWLYASFVTVGMAASSKYTGGSLMLAWLAVYAILQVKNLKRDWFTIGETLFVSGALTFLGFAIGTPKALTWTAFFFKRVFDALEWQATWSQRDDSVRGIIGQFSMMRDTLGMGLYILFIVAVIWAGYRVIQALRRNELTRTSQAGMFGILLLGIFFLDLPVMISYNYQPRYLLTFMPMLAVLAAYLVFEIYTRLGQFGKPIYSTAVIVVVAMVFYSFARLASIALLFINDSRIPATEYMKTLRPGTSLEHTNYPPTYAEGFFEREHNYPLHIQMGTIDTVPTDKPYEFNKAEEGLLERGTEYLIVDSFTANRFSDPHVCEQIPNECEFFKQLETGRTDHYLLIAEFNYSLPWYMPQVHIATANPYIRIYERIDE